MELIHVKISDSVIQRRKIVIVIWVLALIAMTPLILNYSHYISYSNTTSLPRDAESQIASRILSNVTSQNQSLIILVNENPYNMGMANETLHLQKKVSSSGIGNLTGSDSPYSCYEKYISKAYSPLYPYIRNQFSQVNISVDAIFSFPFHFLSAWAANDFNFSLICYSAQQAGFNRSSYESHFLSVLNGSTNSSNKLKPQQLIEYAINSSVQYLNIDPPLVNLVLKCLSIENYSRSIFVFSSQYISQIIRVNIWPDLLTSVMESSTPPSFYVKNYGLYGVPKFISSRFIDPNSTAFIVTVNFNSPLSYTYRNGSGPSEIATPALCTIASQTFGKNAVVTGEGAIEFQTQQVTSKAGIAFAFIFVILALAIFLTLVSWIASLLGLIIVSVATALGYVSIYISGIFFHSVNYVVNYTLTAVILGVSTDYFIFMLSRFRSELRRGRDVREASVTVMEKSGRAVITSGLAVAASLAMFSFVPGFGAWGSVLSIAIISTVIFEVTVMPVIMMGFGRKLFMKRGMKPLADNYHRDSIFYRISRFASKRRVAVIALVLILAAPAAYLFFSSPTTYNFDSGLPSGLSSVRGLNEVESDFGSNILYPIEIILPLSQHISSGNISSSDLNRIMGTASYLSSFNGIKSIIGPYFDNLTEYSQFRSFVIDNGSYTYFLAYSDYGPYSSQAISLVKELRSNQSIIVGGATSSVIDQQKENNTTYTELAFLIVTIIAVILFVSFRSAKYPVISLSGVFMSIVWTVTLLLFISKYVLHQQLIYLIPIILFVILMSLGNDYTVFVISRVREELARENNEEGIARGMVGSGKVVTSLGLVLAASLGVLAAIPSGFLEQLGIAFIISLILDTFIIRTVHFPAMLTLMQRKTKKGEA